jgi:RNA 3'-terminal phosphate cyclase-like protein
LSKAELSLLKLLEKVTNGSQTIINKTGTQLMFKPGIIDSNDGLLVEHDCCLERSLTYYVEPLCMLGLFGKCDLWVELKGNTDDIVDQGIDSFYRAFAYLCS